MQDGLYASVYGNYSYNDDNNKNSLDASQPKNFMPFSNLAYLSKLLERVVQMHLQTFLDRHNVMQTYQSTYRKFHSTETALLRLYNNVLVASDAVRCLVSVCWISRQRSTQLTTNCCCIDLIARLESGVRPRNGSSPT